MIYDKLQQYDYKALVITNLARIQLAHNQPESAIKTIEESIIYSNRSNSKLASAFNHKYLAIAYIQIVKNTKCEKRTEYINLSKYHLLQAIDLFKLKNIIPELKLCYEENYKLYDYMGVRDSSLKYLKLFTYFPDPFQLNKRATELAILEGERLIKEQKTALTISNLTVKSQHQFIWIIALISILLVFALVFLAYTLTQKRVAMQALEEKNKIISEANNELDILSKNLSEINNEIELQNEELQNLNSTKDKFFSIIAHDLKSPFSGFLLLTKMMAEDIASFTHEELQKAMQAMNKSARNLFKLIENLLEWARLQRGDYHFEPILLKPNNVANDVLIQLNDVAKNKEIALINNIAPNLQVYADPNMLNTIMRNLVSNAIKFSLRGQQIEVISLDENGITTFKVIDNGIGIKANQIDKIFRLDEKVSNNGTEGETGTGLGLMLCKEFVEKHDGTIWVESELGKGTTFSFTMNLPKPEIIEDDDLSEFDFD